MAVTLLGLIIGVLLVLFIQKFWPLVRRWRQQVAGRVEETRAWVRSGIDTRYRQELATYLEHYHLLSESASLPAVFVAPHFLAPTALVKSDSVTSEWARTVALSLAGIGEPYRLTPNRLPFPFITCFVMAIGLL